MSASSAQIEKAEQLRALHQAKQPFLLPNIWEPLGAALLENLGYKAIATSSSAMALTNGLLDGENMDFSRLLFQLKNIADAVSVPVTADIEKGYADSEEELDRHIDALLDAGIVGINIEDGDKKTNGLVSTEKQCNRIKRIKQVAKNKGIPLVINARTDTYIHGHLFANPTVQLQETIQRGNAYQESGADCFFPILIKDENAIKSIVEQVRLPVNIMAIPGIPSFEKLTAAGVKRISLGSSFLKIAIQAMQQEALLLKAYAGQDFIDNNTITSAYLESLIAKDR